MRSTEWRSRVGGIEIGGFRGDAGAQLSSFSCIFGAIWHPLPVWKIMDPPLTDLLLFAVPTDVEAELYFISIADVDEMKMVSSY